MSYHRDADHPLANAISTPSLSQPSFESGSLPQTASLSRTSESYHHDYDDATSVPKLKAQSRRSASLKVTRVQDAEVNPLRVSPSPSPALAVKRVMIRREKTGTDWQSVFDVVKYGEEKRAVVVIKEMGQEQVI
ncbi:hypothetical protein DEU56DRAFT_918694 [Suillus clintonianus]|uniref:uncharacterized protein n=1 Tax=Suillus clintonianus TaxID=1904413 RepID=UPI001B86BB8D|nr:uncharacterized protein DEU56DRAFT_918694 [Suillus clintonianus]KAG2119185.1 hypothetical protein DEU56DRAFT_918694 [Suillus clintonianus]